MTYQRATSSNAPRQIAKLIADGFEGVRDVHEVYLGIILDVAEMEAYPAELAVAVEQATAGRLTVRRADRELAKQPGIMGATILAAVAPREYGSAEECLHDVVPGCYFLVVTQTAVFLPLAARSASEIYGERQATQRRAEAAADRRVQHELCEGLAEYPLERIRKEVSDWVRHLSAELTPDQRMVIADSTRPNVSALKAACRSLGLDFETLIQYG